LLPPLAERLRGKAKKESMAERALAMMDAWLKETEQAAANLEFADPKPILYKVTAP
jgi:hypothetical protein